jgi:hypothetical protein
MFFYTKSLLPSFQSLESNPHSCAPPFIARPPFGHRSMDSKALRNESRDGDVTFIER